MPTVYQCPDCGETYIALPQDERCERCAAKLVAVEIGEDRGRERKVFSTETTTERMEGLCVLVCNASFSMDGLAFPNERPNYTKLELVTDAVQSAIDAMHNLTMRDNAYIAIIAFGCHARLILRDRQKKPFIKSVKNILSDFGEPAAKDEAEANGVKWEKLQEEEKEQRIEKASLAQYLSENLQADIENVDRDGTNITEALDLAFNIADVAIKGNLSRWQFNGKVSLIPHLIITSGEDEKGDFHQPNVRVVIYSDGEHNRGEKEIRNPFKDMKPMSVLLTAFIGPPDQSESARRGADTMKALATICPKHQDTSYFLIHRAARGELLRKLFRMATTYSGFCPECAREE